MQQRALRRTITKIIFTFYVGTQNLASPHVWVCLSLDKLIKLIAVYYYTISILKKRYTSR